MPIDTYTNTGGVVVDPLAGAAVFVFDNVRARAVGAAPEVQPVAPAPGTDVLPDEAIEVNVTDDQGLLNVYVFVRPGRAGSWLLAHDGQNFMQGFALYSTRTVITGGFRYAVRYDTRWPSGGVDMRIDTYDREGQRGL